MASLIRDKRGGNLGKATKLAKFVG